VIDLHFLHRPDQRAFSASEFVIGEPGKRFLLEQRSGLRIRRQHHGGHSKGAAASYNKLLPQDETLAEHCRKRDRTLLP
jgi:hypothetical protein